MWSSSRICRDRCPPTAARVRWRSSGCSSSGATTGDRVGIVTFGREARIERLPEEFSEAADFVQEVDRDGSDLGGAIALAASLIPRGRPGRLIVLSDGEANGASVMAAAHEAAARGLPVDFRVVQPRRCRRYRRRVARRARHGRRARAVPVHGVGAHRSHGRERGRAVSRRRRDRAERRRTFQPGATQLTFRDLIDRPGVARYRLELAAAGDRVPENNVGEGAVRVRGAGDDSAGQRQRRAGQPQPRARRPASFASTPSPPSGLPRDLAGLLAYRAVILENVPADQLSARGRSPDSRASPPTSAAACC